jgi:hypothetical protein
MPRKTLKFTPRVNCPGHRAEMKRLDRGCIGGAFLLERPAQQRHPHPIASVACSAKRSGAMLRICGRKAGVDLTLNRANLMTLAASF